MGKLADALKRKYKTPQEAIRALGLDEAFLRAEVVGDELPADLRQQLKMDPNAYAYGQGLALAMDTDPKAAVREELERLKRELQLTDRRKDPRTYADIKLQIKEMQSSLGKDEVTDPPGGANATAHGAKKEVARAALAAKTGVTGGPPTKHPIGGGAGLTKSGRMTVPSNIDWPSKDSKRK